MVRIGEFASKLVGRRHDLVIEVGSSLTREHKARLPAGQRYVRVQYGHEYRLDQSSFIHGAYPPPGGNVKFYSEPDQVWISPHFEPSASYMRSVYHSTVRVAPYVWLPRPSLKRHGVDDYAQAVADGRRSIVITATR